MTCVRGNEGRDRKKGEGGKAGMGDKDVCRTHIKGVVSNLAWLSLATNVFFAVVTVMTTGGLCGQGSSGILFVRTEAFVQLELSLMAVFPYSNVGIFKHTCAVATLLHDEKPPCHYLAGQYM